MENIYYLFILSITMTGVFLAGTYYKPMVERYKKYRRALQRKSLKARVEQLEMRVDLHTRKDGTYLNKFDELEEQINNIAKKVTTREHNTKKRIKAEVINYLKELQQ